MNTHTIVLEGIKKEMSATGGLIFFDNLLKRLDVEGVLGRILPSEKALKKLSPAEKYRALLLGFVAGNDCLDDFDDLSEDRAFRELTGGMASTTLGKFLRKFRLRELEQIQDFLPQLAFKLRMILRPHPEKLILTMDSTHHQQWGKKMEGVGWNYKNIWSLDSQNAFDDLGLCYGFDLRPGNTYSGNGAEIMIQKVFRSIPPSWDRYFRADSAYSRLTVYNELLKKKVKFVIALKENVWGPLLEKYEFKMSWHRSSVEFFDSSHCQIGSCGYPLLGLYGRSYLRVVFIRTKKEVVTREDPRWYKYHAVITNLGEHEMTNEKVVEFYKGRSQVENAIKELKYGMDFKNFPCQKLNANRAWGLAGVMAYNLMRFSSFMINPVKGCFLKRTRKKLVHLACEVIFHARKVTLRFTHRIFQEVTRLIEKMHNKFAIVGNGRPVTIPRRGS